MKFVISDPVKVNVFATIFRQLKDILADVNIDLYPDKMTIQGMGESHACLFELTLQKSWFAEYDVEENTTLGIHCETMFRMIGCLEQDQEIIMHMNDGGDKLFVEFDNSDDNKQTIRKSFIVSLMALDADPMKIPDMDYEADIAILSHQFSGLVSQLSIFGENLNILCNTETIDLKANGDHGAMTVTIKDDDIIEYAIADETVVNLVVFLKYVQRICGFSKISNTIYIHCSDENPLKFHYSLDDENSQDSKNYVRFFVAPKITD